MNFKLKYKAHFAAAPNRHSCFNYLHHHNSLFQKEIAPFTEKDMELRKAI
jgi:hypothetical protein